MEKRIRVVLVDDHEIVREGIRKMLELHPEIQVVGEAGNVEEALRVVESTVPDIILMDIKLPDGNGLEATRLLKGKGGPWEVIILSLYDQYLAQALEAGAAGYLSKDLSRMDLVDVIMRVYKGELVLGTHLLANSNLMGDSLRQLQELLKNRRAASATLSRETTPEASASPTTTSDLATTPPISSPIPIAPIASDAIPFPTPQIVAVPEKVAAFQASINQKTADEVISQGKGGKAPPEEEVEIAITPPVDIHSILSFCTRLKEATAAEIVATVGSWDKGTIIIVGLRKPVPLVDILNHIPEVALACETYKQLNGSAGRLPLIGRKVEEPLTARRRIHVTLKEDVTQLTSDQLKVETKPAEEEKTVASEVNELPPQTLEHPERRHAGSWPKLALKTFARAFGRTNNKEAVDYSQGGAELRSEAIAEPAELAEAPASTALIASSEATDTPEAPQAQIDDKFPLAEAPPTSVSTQKPQKLVAALVTCKGCAKRMTRGTMVVKIDNKYYHPTCAPTTAQKLVAAVVTCKGCAKRMTRGTMVVKMDNMYYHPTCAPTTAGDTASN